MFLLSNWIQVGYTTMFHGTWNWKALVKIKLLGKWMAILPNVVYIYTYMYIIISDGIWYIVVVYPMKSPCIPIYNDLYPQSYPQHYPPIYIPSGKLT